MVGRFQCPRRPAGERGRLSDPVQGAETLAVLHDGGSGEDDELGSGEQASRFQFVGPCLLLGLLLRFLQKSKRDVHLILQAANLRFATVGKAL